MQDLYRNKSVTVIGGGLAGLSSAVFLCKKGFKVSLFEASPKLGGRVYSFFDKNAGFRIDNGQHILASWYKNTFEYLKIIGSYDKLDFQKQLEVNFADPEGKRYLLKTSKLPPPFNLAGGILGYKALSSKDKLAVVRLVNLIKKNSISEESLKEMNTDKLFETGRQTKKAINNFWKPFIIAVFNAEPENTSAYMFAEMIKLGFIEKGNSELVIPKGFLSDIFIEPAADYLNSKNAEIAVNNGITKFNFSNNNVSSIITEDNREFKSDFYILAVPFFNLKALLNEKVLDENDTDYTKLKTSPIVNIHLKFDKSISDVFKTGFIALLGTESQWAFKVTDNQVCIVISAAEKIAEMDKETIIDIAKKELFCCLPQLSGNNVVSARVLKEMRATFVPDSDSLNRRPGSITGINNMLLAGDWTNTGLPATIEGAVKSGKTAVNKILDLLKT